MADSIAEVVAKTPLYRDLTPAEAEDLAAGLELRRFGPGEALTVQGATSDGAYVIASGTVVVTARLPGGGESAIAELGPGDLVGEMSLLMRGGRRTATARARGDVEALFTDRRYFEAALHLLDMLVKMGVGDRGGLGSGGNRIHGVPFGVMRFRVVRSGRCRAWPCRP